MISVLLFFFISSEGKKRKKQKDDFGKEGFTEHDFGDATTTTMRTVRHCV